jgi:hypothetical protein
MQNNSGPPEHNNWFQQLFADFKEFIERCFGVNDVEKRYDREVQVHEKRAASKQSVKRESGYEATTKKL